MPKININRLKTIIREELQMLHENPDLQSAAALGRAAASLHKAVSSFKESASEKAKAEMPYLEELEQTLERIVSSPVNYVDSTEAAPAVKKVTMKVTSPEKVM